MVPAMGDSGIANVDGLLQRWRDGDPVALERLLPLVYADLRRIASRLLRSMPGHATLQTTALVHEVWLRLLGREPAEYDSSAHFLNASALIMRQVLVNRARRSAAEKRGGHWRRADFADVMDLPIPDGTDLLVLDEALTDLACADARMAQVVQLRYFVGLEVNEVAVALDISERTAQRDWASAHAWLRERLRVA